MKQNKKYLKEELLNLEELLYSDKKYPDYGR